MHRREASKPNAIWQADHAQLDILLLKEDGTAARPWLTIVIEDYSRAIAGYYLGFDPPSSLRTCLALRQGIWRKSQPHWHICGIPEILYVDNGSDFTSNRLEQVAADLKMRLVFSIPGEPQGRGRSNDSLERSTRSSYVIWRGTRERVVEDRASLSDSSTICSARSCWKSTTVERVRGPACTVRTLGGRRISATHA